MRAMEEEMEELKRRNGELELIVKSAQSGRKRVSDEERDARRRVKQLERENEGLKEKLLEFERSF